MRIPPVVYGLIAFALIFSGSRLSASGLPVVPTHPRVLLTPSIKAALMARKNANDPRWLALKAKADVLKTYPILKYVDSIRTTEVPNTIFYDYQGEGWWDAAVPLGLAFQMTGDVSYSDKLLALVDEMIRAQNDPDNMPPLHNTPLQADNYYPTRNLGPLLAIAYDWCYDQLGDTRKAAMVSLMNIYFADLRDNAYEANDHSDGNYYVGHLFCTGMMGYASYGDNSKAQEMIDWARIRLDGSPSALIDDLHSPADYFSQLFEGGALSEASRGYNARVILAAPLKGGVHIQGWAYGAATYNWIIDYMLTVKSATGEDLITKNSSWLSQIFRASKHGLMPNKFEIDPNGDFGGRVGAVISRSLPDRLAYTLAGSADGPGAQHYAYEEIVKTSPLADFPDYMYQDRMPPEWEDFYFSDPSRPSTELTFPPYYSGFGPVYPQAGATNGALPYFIMRSDWGPKATWASFHGGAAFYDDHQHTDAGHIQIKHADDYLVIDAANWKGDTASNGIIGDSQNSQYDAAAAANTLFFDDFGDYQRSDTDMQADGPVFCGGQSRAGRDEVIAAEMTDNYSYIRSDLSTAYNATSDTTDTGIRKLVYFYRNFAYIRPANIFVVFDQTKVLKSSNPAGEYRYHIRWHFPDRPVVTGNTLKVEQHDSRANMAFLLPDNALIQPVSELENPDPGNGRPYGFNSGTWRVEVSNLFPSSPPFTTPYLTVIQPTFLADPAMATSKITATGETMIGALVTQPGKGSYVMMFNNGDGQTPAPISSVIYSVPGASDAVHILGGMKPGSKYTAVVADPLVTVTENAAGTYTASAAGVLQFGATSGVEQIGNKTMQLRANYPNPFNTSTTIHFVLPQHQHVTLTLHDALGRAMKILVDADLDAGNNSIELKTEGLPNGIYSYTLQSEGFSLTQKCVILK